MESRTEHEVESACVYIGFKGINTPAQLGKQARWCQSLDAEHYVATQAVSCVYSPFQALLSYLPTKNALAEALHMG